MRDGEIKEEDGEKVAEQFHFLVSSSVIRSVDERDDDNKMRGSEPLGGQMNQSR